MDEMMYPKLPDNLLWFYKDIFATYQAFNVRFAVFFAELGLDGFGIGIHLFLGIVLFGIDQRHVIVG